MHSKNNLYSRRNLWAVHGMFRVLQWAISVANYSTLVAVLWSRDQGLETRHHSSSFLFRSWSIDFDLTPRYLYNSSSPCWCTDVFIKQLRCTWWNVAHEQPTSSVVNTCGPPVSGRWSFRRIDWTAMVVGVLLLRARRPGIRRPTVFVTSSY